MLKFFRELNFVEWVFLVLFWFVFPPLIGFGVWAEWGIAYRNGVEAGRDNIPVLANPYSFDAHSQAEWLRGWKQGRQESGEAKK